MNTCFDRTSSGTRDTHLPASLIHKSSSLVRRISGLFGSAILGALVVGLATPQLHAVPAPNTHSVLILGPTVVGGASSDEAVQAVALGFTVVIADAATWAATTQAEFATYRALILGDPHCVLGTGPITAALANRTTWSPVINGNIIAIGTDEVFHDFQGGLQVTINAINFAANAPTKTGLMVSLSCYYHDTTPATPVAVLDQFGTFTVTGVGCYNNAHIVATHPALTSLTDASLSNWSCSVHEAFDGFPATGPSAFLPLVIARGITGTGSLTFLDGSFGIPYILARGEGLVAITNIHLAPLTADNPVGTTHTVTATVTTNTPTPGTPLAGATVTFLVTAGPNTGATGTAVTNASGVATFTYLGAGGPGTDTIRASFVDSAGVTQFSNNVVKNWIGTTITIGGVKFYDVNANGVYNPGVDIPIPGWKIQVVATPPGGSATTTTYTTNSSGAWSTSVLVGTTYTVCEVAPVESSWMQTTTPICYSSTSSPPPSPTALNFGNVCLGAGGGMTLGFWSNKNGQALVNSGALTLLNNLNLRYPDGTAFDPGTSYSAFRTWLLSATATNMAYMLSAQLAAMELNVYSGKVSGTALVYAPGTTSANSAGFATIGALMTEANTELGLHGYTVSDVLPGSDFRAYQQTLKDVLDAANNNLTFVQATPCSFTFPTSP